MRSDFQRQRVGRARLPTAHRDGDNRARSIVEDVVAQQHDRSLSRLFVTDDRIQLFAEASFINGEDYSYFGTWRNLDSVSLGASYRW